MWCRECDFIGFDFDVDFGTSFQGHLPMWHLSESLLSNTSGLEQWYGQPRIQAVQLQGQPSPELTALQFANKSR